MAKIFGDVSGKIVRMLHNEDEENELGYPDIYDSLLEFDEESNQEIINRLDTDWNPHSLVSGVLYYDGNPVTINSPGESFLDREFLRDYWQQINAYISQLTNGIDAWDGLSDAQKQNWFLNNFDDLLRMVRGILRFVRWLMKVILKRNI